MMMIEGSAIVLGDNVNTDLLHPPAFFSTDSTMAAEGAFAGLELDKDLIGPPPFIIIARKNFGCGSSRESTAIALKKVGVAAIIAESFSHIFSRNATNQGIWTMQAETSSLRTITGDDVSVDIDLWMLKDGKDELRIIPPGNFEQDIIRRGGLVSYLSENDWKWA